MLLHKFQCYLHPALWLVMSFCINQYFLKISFYRKEEHCTLKQITFIYMISHKHHTVSKGAYIFNQWSKVKASELDLCKWVLMPKRMIQTNWFLNCEWTSIFVSWLWSCQCSTSFQIWPLDVPIWILASLLHIYSHLFIHLTLLVWKRFISHPLVQLLVSAKTTWRQIQQKWVAKGRKINRK